MLRPVKVFRRVLVGGRVAAADVPAFQAEAQVDPGRADLQAVLAAVGARRDVADLVEVFTGRHGASLPNSGTIVAQTSCRRGPSPRRKERS